MSRTLSKAVFFFLMFFSSFCLGMEGKCIDVTDGDTITIIAKGKHIKVRLHEIDAPEGKQECGEDAKRYLIKRILNKNVDVKGDEYDRHGRLLGTVYLGKENINLTLLKEGWAWHYLFYSSRAEYTAAEQDAKTAKRGLWAKAKPIAPWIFRHPDLKEQKPINREVEKMNRHRAASFRYWISNNGKTHNRSCNMFFGNSGTGHYSDTPGRADAGCCGGASKDKQLITNE